MNKPIHIIVAVDSKHGISKNCKIPWNIKNDLAHFRKITTECPINKQNCVIYGKTTFLDLKKPLPNRFNIIVSNTITIETNNSATCSNIEDAITMANNLPNVHNIFICGGSGIYKEAIATLNIEKMYITKIHADYECDNFFPYNDIEQKCFVVTNVQLDSECDYLILEKRLT